MTDFRINAWMECYWEKQTAQSARFYGVLIHQDLWGHWILTRIWGGKARRGSRRKHTRVASREEGGRLFEKIAQLRARRGYVPVAITQTGVSVEGSKLIHRTLVETD